MKIKLSIVLFLLLNLGYAQSIAALNNNQKYIEAKNAFESKNYSRTIELGNQIIDNYHLKTDLYFLLGKAYLFSENIPKR